VQLAEKEAKSLLREASGKCAVLPGESISINIKTPTLRLCPKSHPVRLHARLTLFAPQAQHLSRTYY